MFRRSQHLPDSVPAIAGKPVAADVELLQAAQCTHRFAYRQHAAAGDAVV